MSAQIFRLIRKFPVAGSKLDPIDRQILAELQADGRMTNVELALNALLPALPVKIR